MRKTRSEALGVPSAFRTGVCVKSPPMRSPYSLIDQVPTTEEIRMHLAARASETRLLREMLRLAEKVEQRDKLLTDDGETPEKGSVNR